jgi:anthranilate synthase component 1
MRLDAKETAEHMMLVDLARNDVARISISGTRRVARLLTVERYARVMHLVSSVTGKLAIGFDALDALAACLNVGTLTGAPKIRATELLRETERTKRGPYGGAVGWVNGTGLMDTAVVIRSAVVRDGIAFVRAGAGRRLRFRSPGRSDETRRKASALPPSLPRRRRRLIRNSLLIGQSRQLHLQPGRGVPAAGCACAGMRNAIAATRRGRSGRGGWCA